MNCRLNLLFNSTLSPGCLDDNFLAFQLIESNDQAWEGVLNFKAVNVEIYLFVHSHSYPVLKILRFQFCWLKNTIVEIHHCIDSGSKSMDHVQCWMRILTQWTSVFIECECYCDSMAFGFCWMRMWLWLDGPRFLLNANVIVSRWLSVLLNANVIGTQRPSFPKERWCCKQSLTLPILHSCITPLHLCQFPLSKWL